MNSQWNPPPQHAPLSPTLTGENTSPPVHRYPCPHFTMHSKHSPKPTNVHHNLTIFPHSFPTSLYWKSDLCIPRNETARPRSHLLHKCILRDLYIHRLQIPQVSGPIDSWFHRLQIPKISDTINSWFHRLQIPKISDLIDSCFHRWQIPQVMVPLIAGSTGGRFHRS